MLLEQADISRNASFLNFMPLISLATKRFDPPLNEWNTIKHKVPSKRKIARFTSTELLVLEQSIEFQKSCSAEVKSRNVTCNSSGFTPVHQHKARTLHGHVCPSDHLRIGEIHVT